MACVCLLAIAPASGSRPSVGGLRADNANLASKSRAAVLELYSLDTQLTNAHGRLISVEDRTATLRAERATLTQEIGAARLDARLSRHRLASRLRFIYEHRDTSSLDVVMGAHSLEEAMTQLDDYNRVAASNADVLTQVLSSRRSLSRLSRDLADRERMLARSLASTSAQVSQLEELAASRTAYVAELSRQQSSNAAQIAQLSAIAQAADVRSQLLAATAASTPGAAAATTAAPVFVSATIQAPVTAATTPAPGGHTLTVTATGYDFAGHTSTGVPAGWGIAAVDPSVIPLGTRIVIPGYGVAIAADTGGSIVGSSIDLWFPSAAQAYAWGRRTVTIAVN
jgi:cystine transport system substrate-binding protein